MATPSKGKFRNPLIGGPAADPWVIFVQEGPDNSNYFCTYTQRGKISIRKAATLTGLAADPGTCIWTPPQSGPTRRALWAPELHCIRGDWYVTFSADNGCNRTHRMFVLKADDPSNPQGAYTFVGKIADPKHDVWAIDGTYLQMPDGSLYYIWSGWPEATSRFPQNLYIAPMSDPATLSGERSLLSTPGTWEEQINEGPQVLWHNGDLFIVYSAKPSWTKEYGLALLRYTGGPLLSSESWVKSKSLVFQSPARKTRVAYGPGHCSFVPSPDGKEDWIVFHVKTRGANGWHRSIRAQRFTWNADGTPNFGVPAGAGWRARPSGELEVERRLARLAAEAEATPPPATDDMPLAS